MNTDGGTLFLSDILVVLPDNLGRLQFRFYCWPAKASDRFFCHFPCRLILVAGSEPKAAVNAATESCRHPNSWFRNDFPLGSMSARHNWPVNIDLWTGLVFVVCAN